MKKDFPEIFKRMGGDENFTGEGGLPEMETLPPMVEEGRAKIAEFLAIYQRTTSGAEKQELAQALTETARELLGDGWEEGYLPDF